MTQNIKGLKIINDFIDREEEMYLLKNIYNNLWDESIKRRVQHYGIKFEYKYRKIDDKNSIEKLPGWLNQVVNKLKQINELKKFNPDQCTINEYLPGLGIAPHIDTHSCFTDTIVSLSLENLTTMYFKNKFDVNIQEKIGTILHPRSLLILQKESRYCYSHGIPFRKTDTISNNIIKRKKRVSVTFRQISNNPCQCQWSKLCDSQDGFLEDTRL